MCTLFMPLLCRRLQLHDGPGVCVCVWVWVHVHVHVHVWMPL